jgi:lysophospholipase L1-like esterase
MKIVILADSLALAREEGGGGIPFEATYPYLLDQSLRKQLGPDSPLVIERGRRARTIEGVLEDWFEQVELKTADVVVVHVGIVDCAPRVFLRRERSFIETLRLKRLRKFILNFVHKHRRRIVLLRRLVYVPPGRFKQLVEKMVEKARDSKIRSLLLINIVSPPDQLEERSPGFQDNVRTYNQILAEQVDGRLIQLIDLDRLIQQQSGAHLTIDGVHINEEAHKILARELEAYILGSGNKSRAATSAEEAGTHDE